MVLWIFPGCPLSPSWPNFYSIYAVLFLLSITDLITASTTTSQSSSHHFTFHTVTTKYGALRGVRLQFSSSSTKHLDPVTAYLGIPYASPPINAYRFMPPVAPLPWSGVRPAVTLPPACPQKFPDISNETQALQIMTSQRFNFLHKLKPQLANQSEDCLYLNIYAPTIVSGEEIRPGKFAIVLVIHGESWTWGSGNEFDGGILASLGNHIVVTFNYRLGILGFLRTSNQQSNFGLLDVIAALHWVRENGDSFGGDRNRITLLGYRSGAVVANLLLVAPIAKGLFQRAILISGSVLSPWALQRKPEEVASQVSIQMGCVGRLPLSHPESDLAPCLRRIHLSDLMNFVPNTPRFLSPFAPYVDNILIRNPKMIMDKDPLEQFKRSELIVIFTTSESAHELNKQELTYGFESDHKDRILRTLVRNVFNFHQQEIFSIVKNEYTDWERPIPHPIPLRDATVEALSDCLVIAPALQVALIHSRKGAKTHLLHFSHVSREYDFSSYERLGSLEGDVVPYTMGLPVTNNVPALGGPPFLSPWSSLANFSKQDAIVSETLVHYLSNFVKSGDPNVNEAVRSSGAISASSLIDGSRSSSSSSSGNHDWASLSGSSSSFASLSSSASASSSSSAGAAAAAAVSSSLSASSPSTSSSSRERIRVRSLHWDAFEGSTQYYLNIGTKPRIRSHYRGHKMALWLNLIPQIHLPGGSDVTLAHHSFPDDNPALYVGPVRPLMPYTLLDQSGRVSSNEGASFPGSHLQTPTSSPGTGGSVTTTECPEGTDTPISEGTRHTVIQRGGDVLDSAKEISSNRHHNGNSRSNNENELPGMGGMSGEYDYATALTVTMTVGICLILLNVLVFAAIMCHRKRGIGVPLANHPGNRDVHGGTPLKSPYHQEDYKWPSRLNELPDHLSSYGDGGGEEMGEAIGLSQFPAAACAQLDLKSVSMSNCNSVMRPGRSPSPLMVLTPQKSERNTNGYGGNSACGGFHPSHNQNMKRAQVQIPMSTSIPYCVGGSSNPMSSAQANSNSQNMGSSIRLYLNQTAGDDGMQVPEPPKPPRGCSSTSSNTLPRSGGMHMHNSQTSGTASNSGSNPSPNSGTGTLVGVLKRQSTSNSTPHSTVKKRVQIQEISV